MIMKNNINTIRQAINKKQANINNGFLVELIDSNLKKYRVIN